MSGEIYRISMSATAGDKKENVDSARLTEDHGIEDDAHAGTERQVSLLPFEAFDEVRKEIPEIRPGDFAENITTRGLDFSNVAIGDRLAIGDHIKLVITHIGKECHEGCYIREVVGDCIMPRLGLFARIETGGEIGVGDPIRWEKPGA